MGNGVVLLMEMIISTVNTGVVGVVCGVGGNEADDWCSMIYSGVGVEIEISIVKSEAPGILYLNWGWS